MLVPRPDKCAVAALNCETIQGGTRVNQDLMHGGAGLTEVTLEFQNDQTGPWTPTYTKAAIDPKLPFGKGCNRPKAADGFWLCDSFSIGLVTWLQTL